jgi:hypothetical protein
LRFLSAFVLLLPAMLGAMALYYQAPYWAAIIWGVVMLALLGGYVLLRKTRVPLLLLLLSFGGLVLWWGTIEPRSDRAWAAEVEHIVDGDVNGNIVTLRNVRNFKWYSLDSFETNWETRQYDIDTITGVDLFLSYWDFDAIAHTLVGFNFANGDHVVFSIEIRKEWEETYSNIAGFFRQYELAMIAADEADIIFLRTNVRGEDVYRYPINMPEKARKELFLSYLKTGKELNTSPRFYNTVTANCTTVAFDMVRAVVPGIPMDPRIILSGYIPGYLHRVNAAYAGRDEAEIRTSARISGLARAVESRQNYSDRIRGITVQ